MKILSAQQIKQLDAYTIMHEPIASIDLMERASRAFCSWFTERVDPATTVGIICGTGNNGGDGLGIARLLAGFDYNVRVWIVRNSAPVTDDFETNLQRLKNSVTYLEQPVSSSVFSECNVLIDALFGTGLSRPVEGIYADTIHAVNQAKALRIAVDMPSGLLADKASTGPIVKADYTVSFQLPKRAFFLAENAGYVGEWVTVDIGLSKSFLQQAESDTFLLTQKAVRKLLKPQKKFDHKGTRGHALLIAGSYGKMGAAVLASRAVLRTGAGLLTTHVPANGYEIIQITIPEAMVSVDRSEEWFSICPDVEAYTAIGIGPGLGKNKKTTQALGDVLEKANMPMVLDADALNIMSENRELLVLMKQGTILTPHPKEFERLAGVSKSGFERLDRQQAFSKEHKVVVVLKGAHTTISTPEGNLFINNTGNPVMATAGSGDVLTGMLTALLAQGYTCHEAAQLGVWLHGLAGDEARKRIGSRGVLASDIIDHIPDAFGKLN
ncbi:MAG: NAD(P)H-hydrate dehydratase [Cyclobacteriaceae bacterium]|nr:NAD(P)H-hydrate dehydratase [Cyclobacteriaceae bacterium]UYN88513.1 MAG: NAD(P)H-hydrate dehydratase [Cyclobacteriaceae bacterium]